MKSEFLSSLLKRPHASMKMSNFQRKILSRVWSHHLYWENKIDKPDNNRFKRRHMHATKRPIDNNGNEKGF